METVLRDAIAEKVMSSFKGNIANMAVAHAHHMGKFDSERAIQDTIFGISVICTLLAEGKIILVEKE